MDKLKSEKKSKFSIKKSECCDFELGRVIHFAQKGEPNKFIQVRSMHPTWITNKTNKKFGLLLN